MSLLSLPIFTALGDKMRWHQARQGILADNVANADTPGFQAKDIKPFDFAKELADTATPKISTEATNPAHFSVSASSGGDFSSVRSGGYEVTPDNNDIGLEGQMMKVAQNQMDYQAATTLYARSVKILKTALGQST